MRIAVITCYFDPDYVRARSLRAALKTIPDVKITVVKNRHKGMLRYPEVAMKLWKMRQNRPDVYLLTFRGQEILPLVLMLSGKKPVWFDEFIVPIAYASGEKHRKSFAIRVKHFLARVSEPLYKRWLQKCQVILADTAAHAELSAKVSQVNLSKYTAVPVGTDEKLFVPAIKDERPITPFRVFYYSTGMQPLHGIPVVMAAAEELQDDPDIEFLIVGGKKPMEAVATVAKSRGANVHYVPWIPFEDLVPTIQAASLCLGGPFGDTPQAHHVITGKSYQFLACERPVLVGAGEATNEFFVDKTNALMVPQGDADALAKAIKWAKAHPDELKTIAANGRKLYEKEFSTAAIARRLKPLVDAVS